MWLFNCKNHLYDISPTQALSLRFRGSLIAFPKWPPPSNVFFLREKTNITRAKFSICAHEKKVHSKTLISREKIPMKIVFCSPIFWDFPYMKIRIMLVKKIKNYTRENKKVPEQNTHWVKIGPHLSPQNLINSMRFFNV